MSEREGLTRDLQALVRGARLEHLSGALKGSELPVSLVYLGPAAQREQCTLFFGGPIEQRVVPNAPPDVLVVAEPLKVPLDDVLRYSPFLDAVLDVQPSMERQIAFVRSRAHRRRLRKVWRSPDWDWSVSSRPEALEHFYERLHRPYVTARFGEKEVHEPLEHLQRRLARGGRTLVVTHHGEPVCGAALFEMPDGIDYDRNGFRLDSLRSPVLLSERTAALELAIFQLAQELGSASVFLGFCRAQLDDGLFTHKRRLGCRFQPARGSGRSQLWVRTALRPRFFSAVPLVMGPVGAFEVHLGLSHESEPLTKTQWRARLKNFAIPSVVRAVVWTDLPADDPRRSSYELSLRQALGQREVEIHQVET